MAFVDTNVPVHKRYELSVQVVTPEVECLSLIVQVLNLYPSVDRDWLLQALDIRDQAQAAIKTHGLETSQPTLTLLKG